MVDEHFFLVWPIVRSQGLKCQSFDSDSPINPSHFPGAFLALAHVVRSNLLLIFMCWAGLSLAADSAQAKSFRVDQIPNGDTFDCVNCHISQSNRSRNPFGHEVDVWLNRGDVDWSKLYFLDSDGDGYSNGRELGDPCGHWRRGQTPERLADISRPGDPDSVPPGDPGPTCTCGNGVLDSGEECDDGNLIHKDRCSNECETTTCGNGIVDNAELCDDGNDDNSDDCLNICEFARCGDGFVHTGQELCDDGNISNSDACLNRCTPAQCGDGYFWPDEEECDAGSDNSDSAANACRSNCVKPYCGDGVMDEGERCDDGTNLDASDQAACTSACPTPVCGNGQIEFGEQCDAGDANSNTAGNACRENCRLPACGDFVIDSNEACDDGPVGSSQCSFECGLEATENTETSCACVQVRQAQLQVCFLLVLGLVVFGRRKTQ